MVGRGERSVLRGTQVERFSCRGVCEEFFVTEPRALFYINYGFAGSLFSLSVVL